MQIRARGQQIIVSKYAGYDSEKKRPIIVLVASANLRTYKLEMREIKDSPGNFYKFTEAELEEFNTAAVRIKKELIDKEALTLLDNAFDALHSLSAMQLSGIVEQLNVVVSAPDANELWTALAAIEDALEAAGHSNPARIIQHNAVPQYDFEPALDFTKKWS